MKTLIVGFGSPFGDDRIGWDVIDLLKKKIDNSDVVLFKSKGSGVDWLAFVENSDSIYLLDAVKSQQASGFIHRLIIDENLKNLPLRLLSSHGVGLLESVALGRIIGLVSQQVKFFGIEVDAQLNTDSLSSIEVFAERLAAVVLDDVKYVLNDS